VGDLGRNADSYVSSAQRPGAASPLESTLYLIRQPTEPAVRIVGTFNGLGLRGNDSSPVELDGLSLPQGDLLTPQGEGAAGCSGRPALVQHRHLGDGPWLCLAAVAATSKHLQGATFEQAETKLRDLPTLRARIAQMSVRTEQSRALLGYTLGEVEQPSETTPLFVLQSRLARWRPPPTSPTWP